MCVNVVFLESQWKWPIYRVWIAEYKFQIASFAVNAIKKANGRSVSKTGVLTCTSKNLF